MANKFKIKPKIVCVKCMKILEKPNRPEAETFFEVCQECKKRNKEINMPKCPDCGQPMPPHRFVCDECFNDEGKGNE